MPLKALFDDGRKKEIQFALRSGKPLPFHARNPKSDDTGAGSAIGKHFFEGAVAFLDTCTLDGFSFTYYGHAEVGGVGIGVECGDGYTKTRIFHAGEERTIDNAENGTRVRMLIMKADDSAMKIRLDLEAGG